MMSMLLWWGLDAYVGCSRSAGADGLIEKEGEEVERSADGGLKVLWEFFIKDTHDTDN